MRRWLGPTLNRIVFFVVLLALATQMALIYIGFVYTRSIDHSLSEKRAEDMRYQFQQSLLYQLNDIDNLMTLLKTPEFSLFFNNLMRLREDDVVQAGEKLLLDKFKALNLSSDTVQSIYFLGQNFLQRSLAKPTDSAGLEELPRLDMDRLHYSKLDHLFLSNLDRFSVYTKTDFDSVFRTGNPLLEQADVANLKTFMAGLEGHPVLFDVTGQSVYILIVLSDDFFRQALPDDLPADTFFTIVNQDNRVLWSSAPNAPFPPAGSEDSPSVDRALARSHYQNTETDLLPFRLKIVYSERQDSSYRLYSGRLFQIALLTACLLLMTFGFSYLYLRQVFQPFRMISKQIKNYTLSDDWLLRALPEELIRKGFHAVSIRSKLILVLVVAVSVPALADGFIYSVYSRHDTKREMQTSVGTLGQFSEAGIRVRLQFTENILNKISASQQFQDYVTEKNNSLDTSSDVSAINLSMFPGLNDISYFVLLEEDGSCLYSSIFSNNKDVFNVDPALLLDRDTPYWISGYTSVFNQLSTAVVKRIAGPDTNGKATYLLMVPKESIFENIDSGLINTVYVITDSQGDPIYSSRLRSVAVAPALQRYDSVIANNGWKLSIGFVFNDVLEKNRGYQEQFLLIMSIVLLLSIAAAILIANMLVRPLHALKNTMERVGSGEWAGRIDAAEHTEIGSIVTSYNRMIDQLERMMREGNELIALKTKAELDMLKAQINPHFLYNTLEVINMKSMRKGDAEISRIVGALADLLRYNIAQGSEMVELEQELTHAANYVTIQQIRFGHSFEVEYEVPEEMKRLPILRFVLQPIIENAIKHGFAGWEDGGLIRISAAMAGERLQLRVADNGIGMDDQTLERLKADMEREYGRENREESGIGLRNVYQRLKLVYKDKMTLAVSSGEMEGTVIVITIPAEGR